MTQRVLTWLLYACVLGASAPALAQVEQQTAVPPAPNTVDPPVVYVAVPPDQTYYPNQAPVRQPRQRRYREPYVEGMPIPPGGEIITRRKIGLMIPGIAIFGVSYISIASFYAVANDLDENPPGDMLVPVLGPFLAMDRYDSSTSRAALGWAGAMQIAGVGMFVLGVIPRQYVQYYAGTGNEPSWVLTPRANGTEAGLDFGLRF